jgi:Rrf2 family transcriptional regulator, iron-sulfur cluster assembly transcription factor
MQQTEPGFAPSRSIFHAPTRYALQVLVRLPSDGTYRLARCLAADLDLPGPYLAKVLQILGHYGILESHRGPSGGFRLHRALEEITLKEVVMAMEGPEPFGDCLLGVHGGRDGCHCPIHPAWDVLQRRLTTFLAETTLHDLKISHDLSYISDEPDRPEAVPV